MAEDRRRWKTQVYVANNRASDGGARPFQGLVNEVLADIARGGGEVDEVRTDVAATDGAITVIVIYRLPLDAPGEPS